jgi:NarL family two-component system response regulator LiaR
VADADSLARNALRGALSEAGLSVVGQAADAPTVISLALRCLPDVIVMDEALPPAGALAAVRAVTSAGTGVRVIVLGGRGDDEAGVAALASGAAGYLSRDTELRSLARAVARVTAGEAAISRAMASRLIEHLQTRPADGAGIRPVKSELTTREWEVLDLLIARASTADIALQLVLSIDTVHSHVRHILRKLGAQSRAEAVEIAEQTRARLGYSL